MEITSAEYNWRDERSVSVGTSKLSSKEDVRFRRSDVARVVRHFLQAEGEGGEEYLWRIRSGLELQDPRPLPPTRNYSKSLLVRLLEINNVRLFLLLFFHFHRMFRVGELSGLSPLLDV